jgi:uncharacterized protein with von Willebrand factor type A (vWA) domain
MSPDDGILAPVSQHDADVLARGSELERLPARILELGEELRREGVAVGTSEMLDAFEVLREIPWTSQEDFREALAATLAKSQEDRRIFELVFERFFFRAVEIAASREGIREDGQGSLGELSEEELEELRMQIAAAVRDGDARSRAYGDRRVRASPGGLGGDRRGRAAHPTHARPARRAPAGSATGRSAARGAPA